MSFEINWFAVAFIGILIVLLKDGFTFNINVDNNHNSECDCDCPENMGSEYKDTDHYFVLEDMVIPKHLVKYLSSNNEGKVQVTLQDDTVLTSSEDWSETMEYFGQ